MPFENVNAMEQRISMAFIPIRGVNDTSVNAIVCADRRWLAEERLASEKWNRDLFENMCVGLAQHNTSRHITHLLKCVTINVSMWWSIERYIVSLVPIISFHVSLIRHVYLSNFARQCFDTPCISHVLFAIYFTQIFSSISFHPHSQSVFSTYILHSYFTRQPYISSLPVSGFVLHKSFSTKTRWQSNFVLNFRKHKTALSPNIQRMAYKFQSKFIIYRVKHVLHATHHM